MKSSCYNCKNRHSLCHKTCEIYAEYRRQLDVIKSNKQDIAYDYIRHKRKRFKSGGKNGK